MTKAFLSLAIGGLSLTAAAQAPERALSSRNNLVLEEADPGANPGANPRANAAAGASGLSARAQPLAMTLATEGAAEALRVAPAAVALTEVALAEDHVGEPVLWARGADFVWTAGLRRVSGVLTYSPMYGQRLCRFAAPCDGEVVMAQTSCGCGGEDGELTLFTSVE